MIETTRSLSPNQRREDLERMTATGVDILVIGAGVVGAGVALDAAARGLRVGLVEARDYAAGTSSRSSKLVHGGLRYLKQLNFRLVFEALRERKLLLETLCPHLARPVPFIYPLQRVAWDRAYVGTGIGVYDILGAGRGVPSHLKHLSQESTLERFRGGKPGAIKGGILFYEGQIDDARHTLAIARTAVAYGALAATSAKVTDLLRDGDRVVGAVVRDLESGVDHRIRAQRVINATGVWTDDIQDMVPARSGIRVRASKGVHLLIPRAKIDSDYGLITETEKSLLFVIPCPWNDDFWIVGTTDTQWNLDRAHPAASQADVDYLLGHVNKLLARPLTADDVTGVYAGLRPLLAGESDETSKLSREHAVLSPTPGLITVAGGKYTTYRVMAKDAVDEAVKNWPTKVDVSRTDKIPLIGAGNYRRLVDNIPSLAAATGFDQGRIRNLLARYGDTISELFDLIQADPDLAQPVPTAEKYLKAEIHYAVSHEGALHLDDILTRRTRASVDTDSRGVGAAPAIAELVAPLLGWTEQDISREIEHYTGRVEAERDAQTQPDDRTADAARLGAPDVRMGAHRAETR